MLDSLTFISRRWQVYCLAIVAPIVIALLYIPLIPIVGTSIPLLTLAFAVVISAQFGGFGPGLLATILGGLLCDYLFFEPPYTLFYSTLTDSTRVIFFLLIGLSISILGEKTRRALHLAQEHEQQLREEVGERRKTEQLLQKALEKAKEASEAKTAFLANMSHEIRTPMNAVLGLSGLLARSQPLTDQQRTFIQTLHSSAASLLELINDLLDISRIEAGSLRLENISFQMSDIMSEVLAITQYQAKAKNINLQWEEHPVCRQFFLGDPMRIRQVILNLVNNAVKFTHDGGVTIAIFPAATLADGRINVHIAVHDTGIGISKEKQESVFDKFVQADNSVSRKYGGTGLGLAISRNLAEMMEGALNVESHPGEGSTFTLCLPLQPAEQLLQNHSMPPKKMHSLAREKRNESPMVLLVEDNPANLLVTETLLEEFGYLYDVATDGNEALLKIKTNRDRYDIILMDIQLPIMDGMQITRNIRKEESQQSLPRLPILGMTAHALMGDNDKCIDAGMDDYLAKPFNPYELKEKILQLTSSENRYSTAA